MKFEHLAINVANPKQMAKWYATHLGLRVIRQEQNAPFTTFLADDSGNMMLEIYNNPPEKVPDYWQMDPLILHLAFVSANPDEDINRLLEAGAILIEDERLDATTRVVMMRDPWGLPIQLCKRGTPMLADY